MDVTTEALPRQILLPYQKEYIKLCDANRCVIVKKGRQSGFSLTLALWAVRQRLKKVSNCYYISRTERTAKQFARYVKTWCEVLNIVVQEQVIDLRTDSTQTVITFPSGNFIQVMPAGEDVVRGLPGDVLWDEAAFHPCGQAFYDATFPTIQAGHRFHIISTVGSPTCFYEQEWDRAQANKSVFTPFMITMDKAVEQGLADYQAGDHLQLPKGPERNKAFVEFIKKGMSKEAYDCEYNCIQRGLGGLITQEEFQKQALCEVYSDMATLDAKRKEQKNPIRELFGCIDPAFTHDLAAIWILERCYDPTPGLPEEYRDVYVTVCVNTWHKIAPRALHQALKPYLNHPNLVKVLVDQGGPGYQLAKDLSEDYGGMVEALVVTNPVKAEAYERVKYFLQVDRLGLPKDDAEIQKEFLSVKRMVGPTGTVTYDAQSGASHGDRFCACAFALHAAERSKSRVAMASKNDDQRV